MTDEPWPPPPSPADRWVTRPVLEGAGWRVRPVRLREVILWGRLAYVNEAGEVWCSACCRMVGRAELAGEDNAHAPGLPPRCGLRPIADDEDRRADDPWPGGF